MVWEAKKYKHCNFPAVETTTHKRMEMSMQIKKQLETLAGPWGVGKYTPGKKYK